MSDLDLDLDAIRERLDKATKIYGDTLDCTDTHDEADLHEAGLLNALYVVLGDARTLLSRVQRLRANQLPDGGVWTEQVGWVMDGRFIEAAKGGLIRATTHRRRVWTAEPIADVAE